MSSDRLATRGADRVLQALETLGVELVFGLPGVHNLVGPDFAALAAAFGIASSRVTGFGPEFEAALAMAVESGEAHLLVVDAQLKPPPTTSPRWYRRREASLESGPAPAGVVKR